MGRFEHAKSKIVIMDKHNFDSNSEEYKIHKKIAQVSICICGFNKEYCGQEDPDPRIINSEYFNMDKIKKEFGENAIVALILSRD